MIIDHNMVLYTYMVTGYVYTYGIRYQVQILIDYDGWIVITPMNQFVNNGVCLN